MAIQSHPGSAFDGLIQPEALDRLAAATHLIRSRRSIRRYQTRPVPIELVETLLETATWAPSAHNRQPWRFAILSDHDHKERLARAMGERLRQDRLSDGDPPAAVEQDVQRSVDRLCGAPIIVLFCLSMADMDVYEDSRRAAAEKTMAIQSVAMAGQTFWLAAHSAGLACCWLCAPLFVPELVRLTLDLPADWEPQGLMIVGWPAEEKQKKREPLNKKVRVLQAV